ncbi:hypothetical protein COX58_01315 [archaeon CG_4_10_14_0_2_um_filter_Archaea_38_6]|nr:MAG: hypothetical protein COS83_04980 [archaeon CG07_land_8_20_14_0_80_38_8]PIU88926.1 MAG: hypothetical protein COS64_02040 [archaeon CG06_land_8_20_14_3_00_37_11]PJA22750.1 MAG: hypothetical protein COX58_01315 [archaeon CG_4_10_14_0_2_um_filter_Archaea_38_6]
MKMGKDYLITHKENEILFITDELKKENNFFKKLKNDTIYNCSIGCDTINKFVIIDFYEKISHPQLEKVLGKIKQEFIKSSYNDYN